VFEDDPTQANEVHAGSEDSLIAALSNPEIGNRFVIVIVLLSIFFYSINDL
jgi:hypothetical protein